MIRAVKFRCRGCPNIDCEVKPLGSWSTEEEGCVKHVSQLQGNKFYHYIVNVKQELRRTGNMEVWDEWDAFIDELHRNPIAERFKK